MAESPLVTVVMAGGDASATIASLDSVVSQTLANWEALVPVDGAPGAPADPRVRAIGVTESMPGSLGWINAGLREARGEWLAFLVPGDRWRRDKLERQLRLLVDQRRYLWSYSAAEGPGADAAWRPYSGYIVPDLLVHEARVALSSVVANRELVDQAGGFDESMEPAAAYDLWLKLAREAEVVAVPEPLVTLAGPTAADAAALEAAYVRVYARLARMVTSHSVRRVLDRERANHSVLESRAHRLAGRRGRALGAALRAVRHAPGNGDAWGAVAGAFLP